MTGVGGPLAERAPAEGLAHRRHVRNVHDFHPFHGTNLFERIGGQPSVDRVVDAFYHALEQDTELRSLFPADLAATRHMHGLFFAEWLDGPPRYSEQAHGGLAHRHDGLPITTALAEKWLTHFDQAVRANIDSVRDQRAIIAAGHALAMLFVTRQRTPSAPPGRRVRARPTGGSGRSIEVGWCSFGARTVKQATDSARRGDSAGLSAILAEAPDLELPTYAAAILQEAVLAGQTAVVEFLLHRGTSVDLPFYLPVRLVGAAYEQVVYATPLCVARLRRRHPIEAMLLGEGAVDDIFTAAFVGDLATLARMLSTSPTLAGMPDPAGDVLDITPVDHAVAGGHVEATRFLLEHVRQPQSSVRALRAAAAAGNVDMVDLLMAHGADAHRIGVGRWVLHPELAPLLVRHGATIGSGGAWIAASCTGNQNRKDDPDYVRALLRHGAHVDDRRTGPGSGVSGSRDVGATALHYAAKAGFVQTVAVLLEHGADLRAEDSNGRTPLDWLDQAAPTPGRAAVRAFMSRLAPPSRAPTRRRRT